MPVSPWSARRGTLNPPQADQVVVLDMPCAYSLHVLSADEQITCDIVTGQRPN